MRRDCSRRGRSYNAGMDPDPDHDPKCLEGIAIVLGAIVRRGGDDLARHILDELEIRYEDFVAAGLDAVDLDELRRAFAAEPPERSSR
ncbi:hypothetical protein RA307_23735 [Xanthobacteraceae bacterium Astr-EGSB]|uniref:hypothetical protein n=1 Tax=Astrobacterium formosum TaxID=3069710 RepID=UPI0027AE0830|nr:hypothetical protein [Xanthobacteraceae bacterium Astr-EGSB]